jgi:site-specific recombinase XerD
MFDVVNQKYPLVPEGPLGSLVHPFRLELVRLGYTPRVAQDNAYVLACLSRWLDRVGLAAGELGEVELEWFVARRRELGYRRWRSVRSLAKMLVFLRGIRVIPPAPAPVPVDQVTVLLDEFGHYLLRERRLEVRTVALQRHLARRFLLVVSVDGSVCLERVCPDLLIEFVSSQRGAYALSSMKRLTCALRSFLRFLFTTGRIGTDLSPGVPSVAGWRLGPLPESAGADVVPALLASCDRSSGLGLRDYAVLMLMARLGLRAIEISRLRLEDVHWRTGQVTVRGKGGRLDRMPLAAEVGAAIADYLRHGRRPSACREVFLRHCGPDAPASRQAIVSVPRRASDRAGIPMVGAHRLRHRMACQVLADGGNLAEIAQLLRHQSHETTAIYAKVDMNALAAPVRPWPLEEW